MKGLDVLDHADRHQNNRHDTYDDRQDLQNYRQEILQNNSNIDITKSYTYSIARDISKYRVPSQRGPDNVYI